MRTSSSRRPPNRKQSPGFSRATKPSSIAAEPCAAEVLHRHAGIAHDGADVHAVAPRRAAHRARARRPGRPAPRAGSRVGRKRRAALRDEVEAPLPALTRQAGIGGGAAHLVIQRIGTKPPPSATVTRCCTSTSSGCAASCAPRCGRRQCAARAAAPSTSSRLCVGTSVMRDGRPGRMARAAGALQQPRHALGRADLQHALDRQEVDAQVEARGADHRLQLAVLQARARPSRAPRGRASRGAARSRRPSRAAPRASPGTRSPTASACW